MALNSGGFVKGETILTVAERSSRKLVVELRLIRSPRRRGKADEFPWLPLGEKRNSEKLISQKSNFKTESVYAVWLTVRRLANGLRDLFNHANDLGGVQNG